MGEGLEQQLSRSRTGAQSTQASPEMNSSAGSPPPVFVETAAVRAGRRMYASGPSSRLNSMWAEFFERVLRR